MLNVLQDLEGNLSELVGIWDHELEACHEPRQ